MTKDRARKQAARERAAATGERYVVALRQAEGAPSRDYGMPHELTHRVPGVPAHVEGGLQARRNKDQPHTQPTHTQPAHVEPRVLVGWQNRIARLFSAS